MRRTLAALCVVLALLAMGCSRADDAGGVGDTDDPGTAAPRNEDFLGRWTDARGRPMAGWSDEDAALSLVVARGPEHCQWESVVTLSLMFPVGPPSPRAEFNAYSVTYVRNASGSRSFPALGANVSLPERAVATGFSTGEWELWVPDRDNPAPFVYLKRGSYVERWPRWETVGCA